MPHIHDQIDFTVEVYIVHKGKVLLRRHDKYGIWLSVGGHIELDEDPVEAALREVHEETGLSATLIGQVPRFDDPSTELLPPSAMNRHRISATHEHVTLVYFAVTTDPDDLRQGEAEISDELRWCSAEDLDSMDIRPHIESYARRALKAAEN